MCGRGITIWMIHICSLRCRGVAFHQQIGEGSFGEGTSNSEVWLDNLDCDGDELTLEDCRHNGVGSDLNNCEHDQVRSEFGGGQLTFANVT